MTKTNFFFFFSQVLMLMLLAACNDNTDSQPADCTTSDCQRQQALRKVIETHDVVMARMAELDSMQRLLAARLDSSSGFSGQEDIVQSVKALQAADKAMWDWMHGFDAAGLKQMTDEEALQYLHRQQQQVDSVAARFEQAIGAARKLLQ